MIPSFADITEIEPVPCAFVKVRASFDLQHKARRRGPDAKPRAVKEGPERTAYKNRKRKELLANSQCISCWAKHDKSRGQLCTACADKRVLRNFRRREG